MLMPKHHWWGGGGGYLTKSLALPCCCARYDGSTEMNALANMNEPFSLKHLPSLWVEKLTRESLLLRRCPNIWRVEIVV